jgi:transcription elongation factor SPT6
LITCRVASIAHKPPNKEQLELANPVRSDQTGLWQCPFCNKKDFPELSEVNFVAYNFELILQSVFFQMQIT